MAEQLFRLPKNGNGTLQKQIQEMLVEAILDGHIPVGSPLPSGRKLAQQLNVARNTVVFAYQQLVDEGFLVSRERSGHFVNAEILQGRLPQEAKQKRTQQSGEALDWSKRLVTAPNRYASLQKPKNWQSYPYPFLYGQYDKSLFPVADWRECCREAAALSAIYDWASDHYDQDNEQLLEQIHTKILPRRGVWAAPDEILITVGAQNAIYLASALLLDKSRTVGMENPGYYDAMNTFHTLAGTLLPMAVDDEGLIIDRNVLRQCDCIYTTPSHHFPSTVSMSIERRRQLLELAGQEDFVIIEDDYESEFNFVGKPSPALKSMDQNDRVIYVGSLSKTLAPGIRLGFMVASKPFIREVRALRRLLLRHTPSNNQFIIAQFLKRGYHDALVRKMSMTLKERWQIMSQMLEHYLPGSSIPLSFGGSAFWIRGPEGLDSRKLAELAKARGVLIEPGDIFYMPGTVLLNRYRLGFSSIANDRIEPGLQILRDLQDEARR